MAQAWDEREPLTSSELPRRAAAALDAEKERADRAEQAARAEAERADVMQHERDWEQEVVSADLYKRLEAAEALVVELREALATIGDHSAETGIDAHFMREFAREVEARAAGETATKEQP